MVAAPVGFQCRECVAEGSAQVTPPAPIPTMRGTAGDRPYVTDVLIGICAAAFLIALSGVGISTVAGNYGMNPIAIGLDGEWYRLLTSVFLHWTILHIGFNMLVLFMLGPTLETVFGHVRFVILFVLAGLGGAVASYCFSSLGTTSVGASGAIFGLMGALIVAFKKLNADITQIVILLGINLVIGFIPGGSIDWRAHIGGLVVGGAVAAVFAYSPKRNNMLFQVAGIAAVVVVLAAMAGWRTADIQSQFTEPVVTPVVATGQPSGTLVSPGINARSHAPYEGAPHESA